MCTNKEPSTIMTDNRIFLTHTHTNAWTTPHSFVCSLDTNFLICFLPKELKSVRKIIYSCPIYIISSYTESPNTRNQFKKIGKTTGYLKNLYFSRKSKKFRKGTDFVCSFWKVKTHAPLCELQYSYLKSSLRISG